MLGVSKLSEHRSVRYVRERPYMLGVPLVVAIGVWVLFIRSSAGSYETMTIHRADFVQQVSVSGTVKAAHTVDLAFEQAGRVGAVYASVGEQVRSGATLAALESSDAAAQIAAKQAALESAQAQLASLKAGARPEDIQVAQAQANKAHQDLANLYTAIYPTLADAYAKAADAVSTQLSSFFSAPESLSPRLTFSSSASQAAVDAENERVQVGLDLARWQRELAVIDSSTATSTLVDALAKAHAHLAMVSDLLTSISTVTNAATTLPAGVASAAALRAYVSAAVTEVNAGNTAVTSAGSNIASQRILVEQLDAQLALTRSGAKPQDIDAQAAQVAVAQAQLADAEAQAAKTIIRAPFAGLVTDVSAKVGEIVSPNQPEISLISSGTFQIETYVPEVSIANVSVGDPATVTLDAYGSSVVFHATVVSIDPAETVKDGVSTYKTTLQFTEPDTRIRSGMTASTQIQTAQVPDALAVPLGAVYTRNGTSYVQVRTANDRVEERLITLDTISSLGSAVVASGLSDGDVVILNPAN